MHRARIVACVAILTSCLIAAASRPANAQMDTAVLTGRVSNPKGQPVAGARVRILSRATGRARETSSNKRGEYSFAGVPPGAYQFSVLAKGFATLLNRSLTLRIGRHEIYNATLRTGTGEQTVTGQPAPVDATRSSNEMTISNRQIGSLPINRRDPFLFTLLASEVKRDDTPLAAALPTSGFDFNGQRARGNEVLLDGADAIDASTGAIRSTVPLEAVRDFQVKENNYMPEYGRAIGGVINVDTRSGSNDLHGDVFGFLRNSRTQARDPFSAVKEPYTRVQAGASLGGALQQNKTFFFLSGEMLHTSATGFSGIGQNNFGLQQETVPCLANPVLITPYQQSVFQSAVAAAGGCSTQTGALLAQAEGIYGAASTTALNGNEANGPTSFPLPVDCSGSGCTSANTVPLPLSFLGLSSLTGTYPTREKTELGLIRLDRIWDQKQRSFLMASIAPSYRNGVLVNVPGQNLDQIAGTRASVRHVQNITIEGQHTYMLSNTLVNETRAQFGRTGFHYGYSPLLGGGNVGVNIPGYAYFGREPYSTVNLLEKRYEVGDNMTWLHGHHTMKFGLDANFVQVASAKGQLFNLNYGGVYNFGTLNPSSVQSDVLSQLVQRLGQGALPAFTGVQAYGLGIPQNFQQGIGNSSRSFDDKMLGLFWQDSWQLSPRLTVNYGVRYDLSLMPLFTPPTTVNQVNINQAAESALNVVEGIPNDYKDIAPRLGLAWAPTESGNTVVRAGFGLYYGVTPLAVIYDTAAADGALSTQVEIPEGNATGAAISPAFPQALNAASLFQGVLGGIPTIPATGTAVCGTNLPTSLGYECAQQRFNPSLSGPLLGDQNYLAAGFPLATLPMTLPVAKNFVSMYSEQGTLSLEHEFSSNLKVTATYTFVRGLHLNRARNINQPNAVLLTQNFANALAAGVPQARVQGPLGFTLPASVGCNSTSATSSYEVIAASNNTGQLAEGFANSNCSGSPFAYIGTPAVFNDFRPSGPNPSYSGANMAGYSQLVALANRAGFPAGYGVPVAWGSVNQQESTGTSLYNGLTLNVSKKFSDHFQLLSSWTWSHALDNTTDLTTFTQPQNNDNPNLAWGNSAFDQRQRWVTSAIIESPYHGKQKGLLKRLLENSFVAPIIDFSSGRPYTVLTGTDYNLNSNANTDRPSVVPVGTPGSMTSPYIPGVAFSAPTVCTAGIPGSVAPYGCQGNLGRNSFVTPHYFDVDLRVDKKFYLGETMNFEIIAEGFNLLNHFNVMAVNQTCDLSAAASTGATTCSAGQPTAAFNPRQFQFALKFNF